MIGEEYRIWLTTLNQNQLRTEENNLKFMASGKVSHYTKVISKAKLKILNKFNTNSLS